MSKDIYRAVPEYLSVVESLFEVKRLKEGYLLVTPFQRPDGDYIEVEVRPESGNDIVVMDNGDSLNFLFASGLETGSEELRDMIGLIMSQHGTSIVEDEIRIVTTEDKLGKALHSLLNAAVAVSHLAYRKRLIEVS